MESHSENLTDWQKIFLQSKANGADYRGEDLPRYNWQWPQSTWLSQRLARKERRDDKIQSSGK